MAAHFSAATYKIGHSLPKAPKPSYFGEPGGNSSDVKIKNPKQCSDAPDAPAELLGKSATLVYSPESVGAIAMNRDDARRSGDRCNG